MSAAEDILRQLIKEHGIALHLPAGDNQIAAHVAQETRLAKGTVLGVLNGSTARLNENTRTKLAAFFNRVAAPPIHPVWLSSGSLSEFQEKREWRPPQNVPEQTHPSVLPLIGAGARPNDAKAIEVPVQKSREKNIGRVVVNDKKQVLLYSNIIIVALQEALDYEPLRHHNQPPPALYIEDARYKNDIRELISELKRLNNLLESKSLRTARKPTLKFAKHFDAFLWAYSKTIGKGAAGLTIAAVASLLYQAGLGQDIVVDILRHWKNLK